MDSIHQAKVKSGHLLHKIAPVQSQSNSTVLNQGCCLSFEIGGIQIQYCSFEIEQGRFYAVNDHFST